jgi:hypothetical protein
VLVPSGKSLALAPAAMLDYSRGDFGWDGTEFFVRQHEFSLSSEPRDCLRFAVDDKLRLIQIDPANPASPVTVVFTVDDVDGSPDNIQPISGDWAAIAAAWDATKRYYIEADDYDTVQSSLKTSYCFISDDATAKIGAGGDQPYVWGRGSPAVSQSADPDPTFLYRRPANVEDDYLEPLSVWILRDLCEWLNNAYAHVTNQQAISDPLVTPRASAVASYQPIAGPYAIRCRPGVVSITISIVAAISNASYTAQFRAVASPRPPTGTFTVPVYDANAQTAESATTNSTTYVTLADFTVPVVPAPDGTCYIMIEGKVSNVLGTLSFRSISAYFTARTVT